MSLKKRDLDLSCSFCGKHQREVRKIIAGPTVYICDECIKLCNVILGEEVEREQPAPEARPPSPERGEKKPNQVLCCSFCGKSHREVRKLIAGPTVYICDECIGLCNDIIAEEIELESERLSLNALPGDCRERIATILERGSPAAERLLRFAYPGYLRILPFRLLPGFLRRLLRSRRRFRAGTSAGAVASEWIALRKVARANVPGETEHRSAEAGSRPPSPAAAAPDEFPEWARPIIDRLAATQRMLEAVAERPRRASGESLHRAYKNLRQTRELLRAGPPTARVD